MNRFLTHNTLRRARLVVTLLAAMVFWTGVTWGSAQVALAQQVQAADAAIDNAKARFAQLSLQLDGLRTERLKKLRRLQGLTDKIEARKRGRTQAALLADIELSNLLQEARALSDKLRGIQQRVRQVETQLEDTRRGLLQAYAQRIASLENAALEAEDDIDQERALTALNALQQERSAYARRIEATPDLNLGKLPSLQAALPDDPEEALAQADELDDARAQIERRIAGLDAQIDDLEQARRLRRKASDFRDREAFFDDATAGGRRQRPAPSATASPGNDERNGGQEAEEGPTVGDSAEDEQGDDSDLSNGFDDADNAPPAPDGDPSPPADDTDDDADFETDSPGEFVDPNGDGARDEPPGAEPEVGDPVVQPGADLPSDPFGNDAVVVQGGINANTGAGQGVADESGSPTSRIKNLEREKQSLERKAKELEARSKALKRRALEE